MRVRTNIVYVDLPPGFEAAHVVLKLEEEGVRVLAAGPDRLRAVTHYGITAEDVEMAVSAFRKVFQR